MLLVDLLTGLHVLFHLQEKLTRKQFKKGVITEKDYLAYLQRCADRQQQEEKERQDDAELEEKIDLKFGFGPTRDTIVIHDRLISKPFLKQHVKKFGLAKVDNWMCLYKHMLLDIDFVLKEVDCTGQPWGGKEACLPILPEMEVQALYWVYPALQDKIHHHKWLDRMRRELLGQVEALREDMEKGKCRGHPRSNLILFLQAQYFLDVWAIRSYLGHDQDKQAPPGC